MIHWILNLSLLEKAAKIILLKSIILIKYGLKKLGNSRREDVSLYLSNNKKGICHKRIYVLVNGGSIVEIQDLILVFINLIESIPRGLIRFCIIDLVKIMILTIIIPEFY